MFGCLAVIVLVLAGIAGFQVHSLLGVAVLVGGWSGVAYLSNEADKRRQAELNERLRAEAAGRAEADERRLAELTDRFGTEAARRIMDGEIWQGATEEMIIASMGRPADIDEKVYRSKTRRTFKYEKTGKNRYALRVTFEDGSCVGWDDKR